MAYSALRSLFYSSRASRYYDIENLNTYPNVNPTKEKGQQLMDAGRVYFTSGARLNNKSPQRLRWNHPNITKLRILVAVLFRMTVGMGSSIENTTVDLLSTITE